MIEANRPDDTSTVRTVADLVDLQEARARRSADAGPAGLADDGPSGAAASHLDLALDEEPAPGGMPVETPEADRSGRRPVVAPQWSTRANVTATLRRALGLTGYR